MRRVPLVLIICLAIAAAVSAAQNAWTIPGDAADAKNPLPPSEAALKRGKSVFASRCQQCHGADGSGNGPAADPNHPAADLTDPSIVSLNPEGVLFYKIWNGKKPMPAFKSALTKDEVWAVVGYVESLGKQ